MCIRDSWKRSPWLPSSVRDQTCGCNARSERATGGASRSGDRRNTMSTEPRRLPRHVGIIMDGNGRWAERRGLPRLEGHRLGADSVRDVTRAARELGIEALTLYAFSSQTLSLIHISEPTRL